MGKSSEEFMRQREEQSLMDCFVSSKTQMDNLFDYFEEIFSHRKTYKDEKTNI